MAFIAYKYRRHEWFNAKTMEPAYGIEAKAVTSATWRHLAENGRPLVFATEKERDEKLRALIAENRQSLRLVKPQAKPKRTKSTKPTTPRQNVPAKYHYPNQFA